MSAHVSVKDLPPEGERISSEKLRRIQNLSLGIGVVALAVVLFLLFFRSSSEPGSYRIGDQVSYSYLFAIVFCLTLGFGGLFWTILHHATNSGWGIVIRRQMENLAGILPWIFVLMIPFWCPAVREDLWEWEPKAHKMVEKAERELPAAFQLEREEWTEEREEAVAELEEVRGTLQEAGESASPGERAALELQEVELTAELARLEEHEPTELSVKKHLMLEHDPLLAGKYWKYLDAGYKAAYVRLAAYTLVFIVIVLLLRNWSLRTDRTRDPRFFLRSRYWSCFFILPFALGFTFLVVDLLMTLNYKWYSTMWGVYLFAGSALSSMALLILVVLWLRSMGYLEKVVTAEHYHLMGKLLLAFCIFWAYISFSQYFLIWYANITEETQYFLLRNSGGWNIVSIVLVVGHFFIPFLVLLWRPVKKNPVAIGAVSLWILLMHVVDIYWVIIPERAPSLTSTEGSPQLWSQGTLFLDLLSLVGVAGILTYVFLRVLSRSSLYPCGDPRLEESINVVN